MKLEISGRLFSSGSIFLSSTLLILAGAFGYDYALGSRTDWILLLYIACLATAVCIMTRVKVSTGAECRHGMTGCDTEDRVEAAIGETIGLLPTPRRSIRSEPVPEDAKPAMIQQSLDLDGLAALRALNQVTIQWLVSNASDKAAMLIRTACLERIDGGDAEIERADRWFEIADGLRSRECRSLPKAELRRSYVAELVGVSKEQVRQIDQGRYSPLTRLLEEIDPKSL